MICRVLAVISFLCAAPVARAEVIVFAAASLKESIDALAAQFDGVVVSYGSSATLARQVSLGAPADVILLANTEWMDALIQGDQIVPASVVDFASNRLVLVGSIGADEVMLTPDALLAALGQGRLAVGITAAVPAGIYAKASLQSLGLWDSVSSHLAEMDNVRSALALVVRGQAPLGIVYQTDVQASDAVRALAVFPQDSHPPIRYQAALVRGHSAAAAPFLMALMGSNGQTLLAEAGFLPAQVGLE
ncbi:molybdate ABC transporter substrate-binding protein [Yoonia sp. BS5-3]|uniref:Molybdate ABC transporter substrate-binding protein n=1 Tax=Yoonia phaeophyticola TaxID=3137369 RepID=A0ABZ2V355_9RHOB